jgi:hypothetical protein
MRLLMVVATLLRLAVPIAVAIAVVIRRGIVAWLVRSRLLVGILVPVTVVIVRVAALL